MIIIYLCPVCENRPSTFVPILFPRRPLIVKCPYCETVVEIERKQEKNLDVEEVLEEAEMILKGAR